MSESLHLQIQKVFQEVYRDQNEGASPPILKTDSVLLESGLDSLGFAVLVVQLEEALGFDPFVLASEAYYPRTFGDFVDFYEKHRPK